MNDPIGLVVTLVNLEFGGNLVGCSAHHAYPHGGIPAVKKRIKEGGVIAVRGCRKIGGVGGALRGCVGFFRHGLEAKRGPEQTQEHKEGLKPTRLRALWGLRHFLRALCAGRFISVSIASRSWRFWSLVRSSASFLPYKESNLLGLNAWPG
jgi:hypothetical protein